MALPHSSNLGHLERLASAFLIFTNLVPLHVHRVLRKAAQVVPIPSCTLSWQLFVQGLWPRTGGRRACTPLLASLAWFANGDVGMGSAATSAISTSRLGTGALRAADLQGPLETHPRDREKQTMYEALIGSAAPCHPSRLSAAKKCTASVHLRDRYMTVARELASKTRTRFKNISRHGTKDFRCLIESQPTEFHIECFRAHRLPRPALSARGVVMLALRLPGIPALLASTAEKDWAARSSPERKRYRVGPALII